MSLASFSLKRPVTAIVMSIIIMLFGLLGMKSLGVREYPSIDPPIITVRTNYVGANADVIESQITEPLEKSINGIAGIRNISSASNQGSSVITVEFDLGVDLEAAANDVRDKVSQAVRQLPDDIDGQPIVSKADANSDAIISMTIKSDTRTQLEVSDYAENIIGERLQTIPGVSSLQIWGQKKYAMRLWIDPQKLAALGLTTVDINNALHRENVELPSGKVQGNKTELVVKTVGKLSTPDDFNDLVITSRDGRIIRFKDVGYAVLGAENEESILRESGAPMVALALVPLPGANYVAIADEFYKRMEDIKKELPEDIHLNIAMDDTQFIKKSIFEVKETLFIAIFLVVVIIYLFFRNWLMAFRPLIDIPVSLIGAFFIMYIMGYSINVLSLLAIVLATGLVVDDGIVVTENIYKKIEKGMSPMLAARLGTEEIFFAVVSTSITLAAVFLPVIFMQGFVGKLFQEFGVVIAGAVLISAFVSLTLTPVLNAKLVIKDEKPGWFYLKTEPFFQAMENAYHSYLEGFLKIKWITFPILIACIAAIVFLFKNLPQELAPLEDRGLLRVSVTAPEGASYEYTDAYMMKVAQFIKDSIPEHSSILTVTAPGFAGSGGLNTGFVRLSLKESSERDRSQQEIADYLTAKTKSMNEARAFVIQQQTISVGMGRGLPVQYVIQNNDFEKIKEKLPLFLEKANSSPEFSMVDVNLKFNKPELNIVIDRDKAQALGVSVIDIAQTLQLSLSGQRFEYFTKEGKQYQVIGQFDRANRDQPLDLSIINVRNNKGELVQLDNLVKMEETSSPPQLFHYDRYKSATISAAPAPGRTIADGIQAMDNIAKEVLDDSFSTALSGSSRDFAESSSNTSFALLLALLLVFLILAAQFESFIDPIIIMMTVPLAIAGALISLWYFNQSMNIFSQIGMIMLIGLVTKNGILIVEFANQLREKGQAKTEAILSASQMRLRPILMTSLATALGALPIAMSFGAASKSRMGMGIVVVGGVIFSLVLTLFVIPAIYSFISREKKSPEEHDAHNTL
ncbi:MAG: efflux RND transporter permease subunit [Chitinophagales bacterium]|nr:efflux RND transporter permease subunit [Chitinophagales bacterium]